MKPAIALGALLLLAACQPADKPAAPPQAQAPAAAPAPAPASTPAPAPGTPTERLEQVERELGALRADQPCSADAQCTALPLGAKGCGGPTSFMAVSSESPDKARAEQLAAEHTAASKEIVSGTASDCMLLTPPAYRCVEQKCSAPPPG